MNVGMLWFDADGTVTVADKIARAAAYYQAKYGRQPNVCFLHPRTLGESHPAGIGRMDIQTSISVLPDHYWLGVRDEKLEAGSIRMHEAA
jgi:hypothetical protein